MFPFTVYFFFLNKCFCITLTLQHTTGTQPQSSSSASQHETPSHWAEPTQPRRAEAVRSGEEAPLGTSVKALLLLLNLPREEPCSHSHCLQRGCSWDWLKQGEHSLWATIRSPSVELWGWKTPWLSASLCSAHPAAWPWPLRRSSWGPVTATAAPTEQNRTKRSGRCTVTLSTILWNFCPSHMSMGKK